MTPETRLEQAVLHLIAEYNRERADGALKLARALRQAAREMAALETQVNPNPRTEHHCLEDWLNGEPLPTDQETNEIVARLQNVMSGLEVVKKALEIAANWAGKFTEFDADDLAGIWIAEARRQIEEAADG